MRVLAWHVHGSWMTAFVAGTHEYLLPVLPDRGPDGRGRARTWDWPAAVRELSPEELRRQAEDVDVVVLQRPHEMELLHRWTGLRAGVDVPAVYVEHDTPPEHAARTRHPMADRSDVPVVHVSAFNALMWDCGDAPVIVVEHGIPDPGHRYTGEREVLGVVVNEPLRRWRVVGTDIVRTVAEQLPVEVFGMGVTALADVVPSLAAAHEDLPQEAMHARLARDRAYLHPYRWTSAGLALLEAMMLGMPVLVVGSTAAWDTVPPDAGLVSTDPQALVATGRRWLHDPDEAREVGSAARRHALERFGLERFVADWDRVLKEAT